MPVTMLTMVVVMTTMMTTMPSLMILMRMRSVLGRLIITRLVEATVVLLVSRRCRQMEPGIIMWLLLIVRRRGLAVAVTLRRATMLVLLMTLMLVSPLIIATMSGMLFLLFVRLVAAETAGAGEQVAKSAELVGDTADV